jgi:hypothetical protein
METIQHGVDARAQRAAALREALLEEHGRIDALGARVSAAVEADDPYGALDEWRPFEIALLAHMDVEEMFVLPRFADIDGEAARQLRDEHAAIRAELGALAVALELHTARKPTFDALAKRLRRHAEAENSLMYTWADRDLPERVAATILHRLRRS